MNLLLIANIIVCVCAFAGFVYGGILFFRPKKALYAQMITLAIGCVAFGRLFLVFRIVTGGNITETFQLGFVGMIGSFLFFFSANYGALDSLVDDSINDGIIHKIIPFLVPVGAVAVYVIFFFFGETSLMWKIFGGILAAFISLSGYLSLIHI